MRTRYRLFRSLGWSKQDSLILATHNADLIGLGILATLLVVALANSL